MCRTVPKETLSAWPSHDFGAKHQVPRGGTRGERRETRAKEREWSSPSYCVCSRRAMHNCHPWQLRLACTAKRERNRSGHECPAETALARASRATVWTLPSSLPHPSNFLSAGITRASSRGHAHARERPWPVKCVPTSRARLGSAPV